MKQLLYQLFLAGCFVWSNGCSPARITVSVHESAGRNPSGKFLAGVSRMDITPPPGYAQGGNSFEAKSAQGFWHRLYSRSIYMEDSSGVPFFLVSVDLWSVSAGFTNAIVAMVHDSLPFIGREHVTIAATHTHQSPGNFSSWPYYNYFAQNIPGYDEDLFSFLRTKIALSMIAAYRARTTAYITVHSAVMHHLVRNRSFEAFQRNPNSKQFLDEREEIPTGSVSQLFPNAQAFRAVDPTLNVLTFRKSENDSCIATASFFAMHPNSLGNFPDHYNGGVFGATSLMLESDTSANRIPVAAMFNGAEGDVSPVFERQGMNTTLALARMLADSIRTPRTKRELLLSPAISARFEEISVRRARLQNEDQQNVTTAETPFPGDPVVAGAEDGRAGFGCQLFCEGDKMISGKPEDQRPKSHIVSTLIDTLFPSFFPNGLPSKIPLALHELGPIVFCSLPGEFTTMLGYSIRKSMAQKLGPERLPITIGLANEYLSYFTTPEEYDAQHYEGASTLYGQWSGLLIKQQFLSLADKPANKKISGTFNYNPGTFPSEKMEEFLKILLKKHPDLKAKSGRCYCTNEQEVETRKDTTLYWEDDIPDLSGEQPTLPSLRVERSLPPSSEWELVETDEDQNMVVIQTGRTWNCLWSKWKAIYFHPAYDDAYRYRLVVEKINGEEEYFILQ